MCFCPITKKQVQEIYIWVRTDIEGINISLFSWWLFREYGIEIKLLHRWAAVVMS